MSLRFGASLHAVRAVEGGKPVQLVICFECNNASVVGAGRMRAIGPQAQEVLDRALRAGGVTPTATREA